MKQLIFYIMFAMACSHALAQEEKTEEQSSEPKAQKEQQETIDKAPPGDVKSAETFIPSEEVSEDLSVSFPIDI